MNIHSIFFLNFNGLHFSHTKKCLHCKILKFHLPRKIFYFLAPHIFLTTILRLRSGLEVFTHSLFHNFISYVPLVFFFPQRDPIIFHLRSLDTTSELLAFQEHIKQGNDPGLTCYYTQVNLVVVKKQNTGLLMICISANYCSPIFCKYFRNFLCALHLLLCLIPFYRTFGDLPLSSNFLWYILLLILRRSSNKIHFMIITFIEKYQRK